MGVSCTLASLCKELGCLLKAEHSPGRNHPRLSLVTQSLHSNLSQDRPLQNCSGPLTMAALSSPAQQGYTVSIGEEMRTGKPTWTRELGVEMTGKHRGLHFNCLLTLQMRHPDLSLPLGCKGTLSCINSTSPMSFSELSADPYLHPHSFLCLQIGPAQQGSKPSPTLQQLHDSYTGCGLISLYRQTP